MKKEPLKVYPIQINIDNVDSVGAAVGIPSKTSFKCLTLILLNDMYEWKKDSTHSLKAVNRKEHQRLEFTW